MDLHTVRRGIKRAAVTFAMLGLILGLTVVVDPAMAAAPLCGDGAAPDYGFTYDLQQEHWTVDLQGYASAEAVAGVDTVLDELNADSVAQAMILILPEAQVGNRVNCAVHFLRYMELGLPDGAHKDNGFVFLIVVESDRIDVHYGVGLGLPALTAPELTALNRAAEATYLEADSLDQALLSLATGFDTVARSEYAPLAETAPTQIATTEQPLTMEPLSILTACGSVCLGILFLLFLTWALAQLGRRGIRFNPSGRGSWGGGFSRGGGFSGGGGRSSRPMRGGSGSGRSGRGN